MNTVEIKNDTLRNLYAKVTIDMKTIEVKGRRSVFVPIGESKDIESITVSIKE